MTIIVFVFALIAFTSTLAGGIIMLRQRKNLHYFFAFSAGSLMAVSFLDLLPESLETAKSSNIPVRYIMIVVVLSFFLYSLVEKLFLTHSLDDNDAHGHIIGPVGAGSLIVHSFFDGAAIGAAFQVNSSVGLIVALAVIFHDFTDGINTVTLMLKNRQKKIKTFVFLICDAVAPVLGVIFTSLIAFPEKFLSILLAAFVGEFIYIGASHLLPEVKYFDLKKTMLAMGAGIALITILTSFI